jgi:hypothetical protein
MLDVKKIFSTSVRAGQIESFFHVWLVPMMLPNINFYLVNFLPY